MPILDHVKKLIPERIAGVLANCGGTNYRRERFAGNLLRRDLTDRQIMRIYHALIFPNGVRKTSARGRNAAILTRLIDTGRLNLKPRLRVLDIGSSYGIDAGSNYTMLSRRSEVSEYVLGDLYTHILYDPDRGLVFDEDGNLLQVRRRLSFVGIYFSYNYDFQRFTHWPKRLRTSLLQARYGYMPSPRMMRIQLVHPSLDVDAPTSPFRLRRVNVFEPLSDCFDLIICMHLLISRYFAPSAISRGVSNLTKHLECGGSLLVGSESSYSLIHRHGNGEFVRHDYA